MSFTLDTCPMCETVCAPILSAEGKHTFECRCGWRTQPYQWVREDKVRPTDEPSWRASNYVVLVEYVDVDGEPRLEAVGPFLTVEDAIEMRNHLETVENGPEYVRNIIPVIEPDWMPPHWRI